MGNKSIMISIEQLLRKNRYYLSYTEKGATGKITLPANRVYHIPAYQREIRWDPENVKTLISDIKNNAKFLGTILLSTKDNRNFDIIDGQQRITVLLLLIIAIDKRFGGSPFDFCGFSNETYKYLLDIVNLDFSLEKINSNVKKTEYLKSDILEQRESFEKIWLAIQQKLNGSRPMELDSLRKNILHCEINVIINSRETDSVSTAICVDYYLDLNDKSVDLDSIDILKAELFRNNFDAMTEKWANVQREIKELHNVGLINYSIPTFYYHYFATTINSQLQYKLNTLKPDLKLGKNISIKIGEDTVSFSAKTHIVEAVYDRSYFSSSVDRIVKVAEFFSRVIKEQTPWAEFIDFYKSKGSSDITAKSSYSMIKAILKNDDEVPKMLLMKYYLEVIDNSSAKKNDLELIYDIYCYSILFSASSRKKDSQQVTRIVMSERWQDKIKDAAYDMLKNSSEKIAYQRAISENGEVTPISGQYFPKNIFAIKQFYKCNDSQKKVQVSNKGDLSSFLNDPRSSAEHFFINQSYEFTFTYGKGKQASISCPAKIKKYISYVANYLYIDRDVNKDIGNRTIIEKIAFLEAKGERAFSCDLCYKYFLAAKQVFQVNGAYPKDIMDIEKKGIAVRKIKEYYKEKFMVEIEKYVEEIKKITA